VRVSVAELFPDVGSPTLLGDVTVAVFDREPEVAVTVAFTSNVTVVPTLILTAASMLLDPFAGQLAPASSEHVHVIPVSGAEDMSSVTRAPVTSNGPLFRTTIV
jgi:hypothetical protein